jgi:anti-sigma regulatory factor (Ser/Thr protein kinase)
MVGEARRSATGAATRRSFGEERSARLAVVVTELATNLLRHAEKGQILITIARDEAGVYVDVLAIDHGPGMRDVGASMRDGHSTGGTPGIGLGAVRRMSSTFDLYSDHLGTVAHSRVRAERSTDEDRGFEVAGLCVPHPSEIISGDAWSVVAADGSITALVVDGLGHGPLANAASVDAVAAFERSPSHSPSMIIDEIHAALRSTRGAVAGVARLDTVENSVTFAGIGNITAMITGGQKPKRLISHSGTLGAQVRQVREVTYPAAPGAVLILHSDGLSTHLDPDNYPTLLRRSAATVAGVLYRDLFRGRDDATVLVIRRRIPGT